MNYRNHDSSIVELSSERRRNIDPLASEGTTPESAINSGYRTKDLHNLEISVTKSKNINVVTNEELCGSGLGDVFQKRNGRESGDEEDPIKGQGNSGLEDVFHVRNGRECCDEENPIKGQGNSDAEKAKGDRFCQVRGTDPVCSGRHQTMNVDAHCAENSILDAELLHSQSDVSFSRNIVMGWKTQHTSINTVDDVAFSGPDNTPDIRISITCDGSEPEDIELQELVDNSNTNGIEFVDQSTCDQ